MVAAGQPDRRAEPDAQRTQADTPWWRQRTRGPPSDPVGLRVVADAIEPAWLVWARERPGGWAARGPPPSLRVVAAVQRAARQRRDEPGQNRPAHRRAVSGAGRPAGPRGVGPRRVRPHKEKCPGCHGPYAAAREAPGAVVGGRAAKSVRRRALAPAAARPSGPAGEGKLRLSASPS